MKTKILFSLFASTLMMGQALAEHHGMDAKAEYSAENQTLVLKNVQYVDENGEKTETIYNATFKLTSGDPIEFTIEGGLCEAPKSWHEPMNHCMDQTMPAPTTDANGCVAPQVWNAAMGHCM